MNVIFGTMLVFTWIMAVVLGSIAIIQYGNKHWGWTW